MPCNVLLNRGFVVRGEITNFMKTLTMKLTGVILFLFFLQETIPYKPSDQFSTKLDYQFKVRPVDNTKAYESQVRTVNTSPLPHLNLNVEMLKLAEEEVKVRISNNRDNALYVKKISVGSVLQVPFGFTDDVKDNVSPNVYTLTFLTKEKKELSRIVYFIDADGTFFVNGEKQGKF